MEDLAIFLGFAYFFVGFVEFCEDLLGIAAPDEQSDNTDRYLLLSLISGINFDQQT